jgi:enolase
MSYVKIERVLAREVLNFRGDPTVEAEVCLSDGSRGRAAVPAGISTGSSEARPLLDGDPTRFAGRGVLKAVDHVRRVIGPAMKDMDAYAQKAIDERLLTLDGTPYKGRLGANAILSVSLAAAHAATASLKLPLYRYLEREGTFRLPVPAFDMLCGGSHARSSVDLQEYLVLPVGVSTFQEALRAGSEIYRALTDILLEQGYSVRDHSGPLAPSLRSNREGVAVLAAAIERAGYKLGDECFIGLDAATSELYGEGRYILRGEGRSLSSRDMVDLWAEWVDEYPIVSIEDGMAEEDWEGWQALTERIGDRVQLVGDDFFTTNPGRIRKGVELKAANAVLIKPNQIGTLTETLEAMNVARKAGWATMLSSRSGETDDTTIADLAVLDSSGQIKTGPPCRQCVVKHNRLLRIAEELGNSSEYTGPRAFRTWARKIPGAKEDP